MFADYEKTNLLYLQAFEEVMEFQLEETRMRTAMERIASQTIVLKYIEKPSPFSFPIMVDRLNREKLSSEKLEDKIRKMKVDID